MPVPVPAGVCTCDSILTPRTPSTASRFALRTARLARQLGIPAIHLALNRVRADADLDRVGTYLRRAPEVTFTSVHALPYDDGVLEAEPSVDALLDGSPSPFAVAVERLAAVLLPT